MNRFLYILIGLLVGGSLVAQNFNINNERTFEYLYLNNLDTAANFHTAIKPYNKNEVNSIISYDSSLAQLQVNTSKGFINQLFNQHLIEKKGIFYLAVNPIVNAITTLEKADNYNENLLETSAGIQLQSALGDKWSAQFDFLYDYSTYPSHIDAMVQTKNISPGYGYSNNDASIFSQGNITFTPDEVFAIQAGYGKHFIGDGYRSLLLSDFANSYPYLKLTANIWKIKYMALYSNHQDIRMTDGIYSNYMQKFATTHYLSMNVTKWLNLGFFESIVFQSQEKGFYRGYDMSYLNPIIFLRSTEYALGSSDNALMGGSIKMRILKKYIFYGQLLFDEFLLDELKAGNGWWANKYGVQAGLKFIEPLNIKRLRLQLEYNEVRPFTYSYFYRSTNVSTLQNYAHFNAPLAHPLGANFKEITASAFYAKKRWIFELHSTLAKVGLDTNSFSVGQDVYQPYNNREDNYGYYTLNGLKTNILNNTVKISYVLNPKSNMILQAGVTNRTFTNNFADLSSNMFFVGLKTAITNRYSDF